MFKQKLHNQPSTLLLFIKKMHEYLLHHYRHKHIIFTLMLMLLINDNFECQMV